jgi:CheY-like chemotaxis protein
MATVLVVDDERDICELIRVNLGIDGHQILVAHDGEAALAAVEYSRPDLVILDVMMPGLDGFTVLERIKRADAGVAGTPVIMLTARTDALDRVRGGIEGAVRYVTKPFSVVALRATVEEILGGEPEPVARRRAQTDALGELARIEAGRPGTALRGPRPRLTRYEIPRAEPPPPPTRPLDRYRDRLSARQVELLEAVVATPDLRTAAEVLGVSRTYLYASLRRMARRVGLPSGPELVRVLRDRGAERD